MNNYNLYIPKNQIYIIKEKGKVTKIIGHREDELPIFEIAKFIVMQGKNINSKTLENAIAKVSEAGEQK
jgi:hypothetical protein